MSGPWFGLSLMLEDDWREAALPIFEAGDVDVLEWSFDATPSAAPLWANALLDAFAEEDRLIGHGVSFSVLSGSFEKRQEKYLERLRRELGRRKHRHFSEHLGFSTAAPFVQGTPLPLPWSEQALRIGSDRLARLAGVTGTLPIGIENLALVYSPADALAQAAFLSALLARCDGFLLLDLHNLHTQSCNTGLSHEKILDALPLERAREIHISGGSWSSPRCRPEKPFRRDTHDEAVPEEVLALLPRALARCPRVEAVIFERIGGTLRSSDEVRRFREDAARIREIVVAHERPSVEALPSGKGAPSSELASGDEKELGDFQSALLEFLHGSLAPSAELERLLEAPAAKPFRDWLRGLEAPALEVASDLARKWGVRRP